MTTAPALTAATTGAPPGTMKPASTAGSSSAASHQSILVCVRVRPLNEREKRRKASMAWKCQSNQIVQKVGKDSTSQRRGTSAPDGQAHATPGVSIFAFLISR